MSDATTQPEAVRLWHEMAGAVTAGDLETARALVTDSFEWKVYDEFWE